MSRRLFVTILALSVVASVIPLAAERRIALIVDTSGSMQQNDSERYAAQISKILSDLAKDGDKIAIIRLPAEPSLIERARGHQDCNAPADPKLMIELQGSQRASFKDKIDGLLQYDGPTLFGAPLHTAIPFLGEDPSVQRLLLLISDAQEGFDGCNDEYTRMLQRFENTGPTVALVKMGGHSDDFAGNPAIQFRRDVQNSTGLISAVAEIYQRFLGSKKVQTGAISANIRVEIGEHVKEAFVVVAADSPFGKITGGRGNPSADSVDLDYRGGGQTLGVDNQARGYRIVRLVNPSGGSYTFNAPPGTTGGWMLLQDYALVLRTITPGPVPAGSMAPVQVEVVDELTGKRVTDDATLKDLTIDGNIGSGSVSLKREASGIFGVNQRFGEPGTVPVSLRLHGSSIERNFNSSVTVTGNVPPPPPTPPPSTSIGPGDLEFGQAAPLILGRLNGGGESQSVMQLKSARIAHDLDVDVSTDFAKRHVRIEIHRPSGWETISGTPLRLRLSVNDPMRWAVRVRPEGCPEGCKPSETHSITFTAHRTDGMVQRVDVPIQVEIAPSPWYVCWRRELLAALSLLAAGIVAYGYIAPFRFGSRTGIQMSPVEDLNEGFYFPLKSAPGSGVGFYRDAVLFLSEDFRITSKKRGGFVRLRAGANHVRMRPENGRAVWRQQADGTWEQLYPQQEVIVRSGSVYRNESQSLFFDVRIK